MYENNETGKLHFILNAQGFSQRISFQDNKYSQEKAKLAGMKLIIM
jgi:hypothetical protein